MNFLRAIKKLIKHLTEEPSVPIVEEQIPEKIIMETRIDDPVNYIREWAIEKIELLHEADRHKNAKALLAEFDEWINLPDGKDEINYLCLENDNWGDQEVDVM